ncbi:MAG TPA: 50S ribosomal protein L29 [Anaerohalosphaeraceae bacterium]|nr:50S ribosomal protein L29 [Anaerohalosphaeraceae bacterium]HOL88314.1 50S ribosomal protein L29 [Anaerohalosphaeraceae bacterium]HPP57002.1 50S ribosomal protein L29 [Anaerohalosphaeraceae bacterium]
MKISEIRELRTDERLEKLQELQRKVFELRCQAVTENLQNRHVIRNIRRDIARIKTVLREEERKAR